MTSSAESWIDDAPPESGVRRVSRPARRAAPAPSTARPAEITDGPEILREVGKQVFLEVWDLMLVLQPLQGAWMRIGLGQMGAIALKVLGWKIEEAAPRPLSGKTLRARWPELVPGYAAMDRLVGLMVDWICQ